MTKTWKLHPLALAVSLVAASQVYAVGTGTISSGTGSIAKQGNVTNVNQTSDKLIVNWNDMNVGAGETLNFNQQSKTAAVLNRVQSGNSTQILGALNAQGRVFVVNPNGVLIGSNATVNVGSLVASTLDISDADFKSGNYVFSGTGKGKVTNQGTINATENVALISGADVINTGRITAGGDVALASGGAVTLAFPAYGNMAVSLSSGTVDALVRNGGLIQSTGGHIALTAWAIDTITRSVINNTGTLEASYVNSGNGNGKDASVKLESRGNGTVNADGIVKVADAASRLGVTGDQVTIQRGATLSSKGGIDLTGATRVDINGNLDAGQSSLRVITLVATQGADSTITAGAASLSGATPQGNANAQFDLSRGRNDIGYLMIDAKSARVATTGDTTLGWVSNATQDLDVSSQKDLLLNSLISTKGNVSLSAQNIKGDPYAYIAPGVNAYGDVTLNARDSIDLGTVSAGGNTTLTAQNGSIKVAADVLSNRYLDVSGHGNVSVGRIGAVKSSIQSTAGNVTLESAYADDLDVSAKQNITLNGDVRAGNVNMTAENILSGRGNNGWWYAPPQGRVYANGDLTLNARNSINLVAAYTPGNATFSAQTGSINISNGVFAGGDVNVTGKGDIAVGQLQAQNGSVTSTDGRVTVGSALAIGDLNVAGKGDVSVGSAIAYNDNNISSTNGGANVSSLYAGNNASISAGAPGIRLGNSVVERDLALKSTGRLMQTGLLYVNGELTADLAKDSPPPRVVRY